MWSPLPAAPSPPARPGVQLWFLSVFLPPGKDAQKPWTEWLLILLAAALCAAFVCSLGRRT